MKKDIIVVGSINMDLVVRTPRHPKIGETIIGEDFNTFPGGKGANQAVAAARLGGRVKMVGCVGQDAFGDELVETLNQDQVDTQFITRNPEAATGVALITVDQHGQNSIVVASGANAALTAEEVSAAGALFAEAKILLLQLEVPMPAIRRAVELAKRYDVLVVLNPAPARQLDAELLKQVDYLIPNQTELALLSGTEEIEAGAETLRQQGIRHLIITLGEEGVLVIENGAKERMPAFPVKAVDTTAAGDAFVGGFAVALSEGKSSRQAAVWGSAAGALAVTKEGAQPSLPHREEFDQFIKERTG